MKSRACFLMAALILMVGCDSGASSTGTSAPAAADPLTAAQADSGTQAGNDPAAESGTVTLEIQRSDSAKTIEIEDVQTGTTLEQVMRSVTQIPISIRGSGVTAFVDGIGEQTSSGNEGWVFRVDGVHANQGVGSTVLTPPTTITWVYGDAGDLIGQ
jgi:hypothetical protein